MSRLDDELADAAALDEDEGEIQPSASAEPGSTPTGLQAGTSPQRNLGLLIVLLVIGSALVGLMLTSLRSAVVYSKGVDELLADRDRLLGRAVRVEGTLVRGSLARRENPCAYRFVMERAGRRLEVEYPRCSIPDTFRDVSYTSITVTAEGRLGTDGRFEATQIMAKCPSKYEEQTRAAADDAAPSRPIAID
ncbi:MAG: cytochrome c maturation protein CcmE [Polyangiaceae bacterium]|nr:cytochrome c maturation protein CcmE [Polyangiaceae bacterium]